MYCEYYIPYYNCIYLSNATVCLTSYSLLGIVNNIVLECTYILVSLGCKLFAWMITMLCSQSIDADCEFIFYGRYLQRIQDQYTGNTRDSFVYTCC